jgi:hypothetical protein
MGAQRIEIQHNERAQVVDYLKQAIAVVEENVPAELASPELVVKVLELLASKTIQTVQPAPIGIPLGMPRMDIPGGGRH